MNNVERQKELAYLIEKGWLNPGTPKVCMGNGNYPEGYFFCDICEHEKHCFSEMTKE